MVNHPEVIAKYKREVEKTNASLAQFETIKKFKLVPKMWTVESGELTPTLKVKRKAITENHQSLIDSMF